MSIIAIIGLAGIASPANAATNTSSPNLPTGVTRIQVPMTADCTDLSAKAAAYIKKHNLTICGSASSGSGQVSPDNAVVGDCGSSFLDVYSGGMGDAVIGYGFDSSEGDAVYRYLTINYSGTAVTSSFNDDSPMFDYIYTSSERVYGGYGFFTAQMTGGISLYWGLDCYIGNPSDATDL